MELKEIREIVKEIIFDIEKNKLNLTYRNYEIFLERIGMGKKRNFKILTKFDYQFKKQNLTLWCGKEEVKKISWFKKGETVTFRMAEISEAKNTMDKKEKNVKYDFAGKINIANAESGIVPYEHQEKAFYSLNQKIIKTNKNPFAGLLVLPTGGGKTLTAGHWIAKN